MPKRKRGEDEECDINMSRKKMKYLEDQVANHYNSYLNDMNRKINELNPQLFTEDHAQKLDSIGYRAGTIVYESNLLSSSNIDNKAWEMYSRIISFDKVEIQFCADHKQLSKKLVLELTTSTNGGGDHQDNLEEDAELGCDQEGEKRLLIFQFFQMEKNGSEELIFSVELNTGERLIYLIIGGSGDNRENEVESAFNIGLFNGIMDEESKFNEEEKLNFFRDIVNWVVEDDNFVDQYIRTRKEESTFCIIS